MLKIVRQFFLLAHGHARGGPNIKANLGETCGGDINVQIKSTQQIISCSSFQIHFDATAGINKNNKFDSFPCPAVHTT